MEIQLSSSGLGWGTGDLSRDVDEIGKAVEYLRDRATPPNSAAAIASKGGKVVLMGHSTGSQDVLHYLYHLPSQERLPVEGAILQAAVSDREALSMMCEANQSVQHAYEECLRISLKAEVETAQGKNYTLPTELISSLGWPKAYISCKRFLSLASPSSPERPGPDDLFSSDLNDETLGKTFGAVGRSGLLQPSHSGNMSMLILLSAEDEYTPATISKEMLIKRWGSALEDGQVGVAADSGVVAGASHNVQKYEPQLELTKRVLRYLDLVVGNVPEAVLLDLEDRGHPHSQN